MGSLSAATVLRQHRTRRRSSHPHLGLNRQARLQQSFGIEVRSRIAIRIAIRRTIKINTHWHPLHNFHIVPSGVFRRQQAEHRACAGTHVSYMRFPSPAVGVHFNFDGLSRPHVGKLRFLKVRRDPDIVERHYFYKFLPDADVLSDLNCLLANNSCDWRTNDSVAEVEFWLIKLCLAFSRLSVG